MSHHHLWLCQVTNHALCYQEDRICEGLPAYHIYSHKRPGGDAFFKTGLLLQIKKFNSTVQWQWAILDTSSLISLASMYNGESAYNIGSKPYIGRNYKVSSRIFADFNASVIKTAMFCSDFLYFS